MCDMKRTEHKTGTVVTSSRAVHWHMDLGAKFPTIPWRVVRSSNVFRDKSRKEKEVIDTGV